MPVSTSAHISHCIHQIVELAPKSVLDVGCGFGLWGFLCRKYLDIFPGRVQPDEWEVQIDGIEIFDPYIMEHQRFLYDSIRIADLREVSKDIEPHDLIIAGDVIEHIEKVEALRVLENLYEKARMALLVNIPIGAGWERTVEEVPTNPAEAHLSVWYPEEFADWGAACNLVKFPNGWYGTFLCKKPVGAPARREAFAASASFHVGEGRLELGRDLLYKALEIDLGDGPVTLDLVDVLIKLNDHEEAVDTLERAIRGRPDFHEAYLALARLHKALRRTTQAQERIHQLLRLPGLSAELRLAAESLFV